MHTSHEKAPLNKDTQALEKQLNILYRIGKSINSALDLESLFLNIYKLAREIIPTDVFYIGLLQERTNSLDVVFIMDNNKRYSRVLEPLGDGVVSQAILRKETISLNRTDGEISSLRPISLDTYSKSGKIPKSVIVSPIIVRGQVVGVISIQSYDRNTYTDEHARLLSLISTQAGVALNNYELCHHIKSERDKLASILTHLGEGVNIIDVQFKIQFANKWTSDRYGKNIKGKRCYRTFFGFQKPCKGCPTNSGNKYNNSNEEASLEVQTEEGKIFLLTLTPFNKSLSGETETVLEIIRDVTENKKLEEEVIEKEKLQSVIELAGAVGHELNQPLTGITGYCALVKEELDEQHPLYKDISEIEKQAARLEMLANKFQNIARIENQGYSGNNRILDLHKSSESQEQ